VLLAALAFLSFDWFFLPPYGTLVIEKSIDWAVLAAFLLTSVVAARLLARAQAETETANDRAREVDHLASLGAETLNAGRAEDALSAIAGVIQVALRLNRCAIYMSGGTQPARMMCRVSDDGNERPREGFSQLVDRVISTSATLAIRSNGLVDQINLDMEAANNRGGTGSDRSEILLPLTIRDRTVGVLSMGSDAGIILEARHLRFLNALSYYAALGVERVRLEREANAADSLRDASRLKDAVIASVSHDLRTPLTTIKALATEITKDGDERAMTIQEEADRLNALVTDLLDIATLNSGTASLKPEANEAEDLVGAALQRVHANGDGREIVLSLEPGNPLLIGRFDFAHTLRALVNLLENALKYSPSSEPVELRVSRDESWLKFSVLDRGEGIPPSEREKIFEPFYRRPGSPADASGSGLGLSIARALANAQNSSLVHEPRPGGGSVFTLSVPAIDVEDIVEA